MGFGYWTDMRSTQLSSAIFFFFDVSQGLIFSYNLLLVSYWGFPKYFNASTNVWVSLYGLFTPKTTLFTVREAKPLQKVIFWLCRDNKNEIKDWMDEWMIEFCCCLNTILIVKSCLFRYFGLCVNLYISGKEGRLFLILTFATTYRSLFVVQKVAWKKWCPPIQAKKVSD